MSISPQPVRAFARLRPRGVIVVLTLCLVASAGLTGLRLLARETDAKTELAEPVGAVDDDDLLKAGSNNANWLMYGRTYDAQRYSPLDQVNAKNVARLIPVWTFQTGVLDGFECTPLVIDGIMYVTTPWNHAYAIDCKTGSQLWHYQKSLPENLALCCDAVNRGFAAHGDRLYMATLDGTSFASTATPARRSGTHPDHRQRRQRQAGLPIFTKMAAHMLPRQLRW